MDKKDKVAEKQKKYIYHYEKFCADLKAQNRKKIEVLYSETKASVFGLCCGAPFVAAILFSYFLLNTNNGKQHNIFYGIIILIACFSLSIIVHEVLHGVGWCIAGKVRWSHIHITFEGDMPLCHCDVPLKGRQYLAGALLPVILLGFIPAIIAFAIPNIFLMIFSVLSVVSAGGDLLLSLRVIRHWDDMIIDHPTEAGFVAFTA